MCVFLLVWKNVYLWAVKEYIVPNCLIMYHIANTLLAVHVFGNLSATGVDSGVALLPPPPIRIS